jgi:Fe2+ or Zn2+ uptake regulation protein
VYKTLDALESAGLISQVSTIGELKRYDANGSKHHHLICTRCKRITDLSDEALDAIRPPKVDGFVASEVKVQILGLCAACSGHKTRRTKWQGRI